MLTFKVLCDLRSYMPKDHLFLYEIIRQMWLSLEALLQVLLSLILGLYGLFGEGNKTLEFFPQEDSSVPLYCHLLLVGKDHFFSIPSVIPPSSPILFIFMTLF